jgi:outer membrane receptor protein involved in Fe transport
MALKYLSASRTLLSTALATAVAGMTGLAHAQDASQLDEIVVTGSRIRMTGMETPTPVTAMDAMELNTMAPGNMIDSLSQLPQFLNNATAQTSSNFAGSGGASNLNLRGIGSQRTLVLLDGRRVTPSSRTNTVDINLFPDAMIRRVETVTGGASAAYGTDAVAGVVNFILDTDFEGVAVSGQKGITSRGDGENWEGSFSFGTDIGEKSHLLFSASGYQIDGIDNYADRDWYQGWGTVTNPAWQAAVNAGDCALNVPCDAGPQLIRAPHVVSTKYTFGGLTTSPVAALNNLEFLSDGSVRPFQFSSLGTQSGTWSQSVDKAYGGGSGANLHPQRGGEGGLQPELDRENVFLYVDHDLTDNINVYGQVVYGSNVTNSPASQTVQTDGYKVTVYQDNAFLPEGLRQTMIDNNVQSIGLSSMRSIDDLSQSRYTFGSEMTSYTVGFKSEITGGIFDGFSFDGYAQTGNTDVRIRMFDYARVDRIYLAADAVRGPNGTIECRAALYNPELYGNCVPLDLLGAGRASQEAIDYALGRDDGTNVKVQAADLQQDVVDLSMSGEVFDGWGAGPISTAFGVSYREDSISQRIRDYSNPYNDPNYDAVPLNNPAQGIQGIPAIFAGNPSGVQFANAQEFDGKIIVKEAFNEWLVPLLADLPLIDQLNANFAYRWADYSGSGEVWSWKYGLDWTVTDEVRLRGTVSRDVRAGSLAERFDTQNNGSSAVDPLRGGTSTSFTQIAGGNPNVNPEKALTWTTGVVYQPAFLEGLSVSLDYYKINTKGLIAQLGTANIINACAAGDVAQCANVTRGADDGLGYGVGPITRVFNGYQNLGEAQVSGADLEVSYRTDVNWFGGINGEGESISARAFYSYLQENWIDSDNDPNTDTKVESAGDISVAMPRNKLTLNMSYMSGPLTLFVQERIIGEGNHMNRYNGANVTEGVQINDNAVDAVYYTDLNATWAIEQYTGGDLEVFANVTNVFDRDPPIRGVFSDFAGSTQHVDLIHDSLGRRYTMGARLRF